MQIEHSLVQAASGITAAACWITSLFVVTTCVVLSNRRWGWRVPICVTWMPGLAGVIYGWRGYSILRAGTIQMSAVATTVCVMLAALVVMLFVVIESWRRSTKEHADTEALEQVKVALAPAPPTVVTFPPEAPPR